MPTTCCTLDFILRPLKRWNALLLIASLSFTFNTCVNAADAVDFRLLDLSGQSRSLSDYRGQWVIINFWATWCAPCLKEIPELVRFQNKNSARAQVIGIDFEQTPIDEVQRFVRSLRMNYPVLRIGDQPLLPFEPLKGLPSTFFISPQGAIVHRHLGPITADQLELWLNSQTE